MAHNKYDELYNMLSERRSIRSFSDQTVSTDSLGKILSAGLRAPSACNKQMWEFIVVSDPSVKSLLVTKARAQKHIANASISIYVIYPKGVTSEGYANIQSASAAIQNMSLACHALGLGSVWVEACGKHVFVRDILNIPKSYHIIAALCIGVFLSTPKQPPQRSLEATWHTNRFSSKLGYLKKPTKRSDWNDYNLTEYRTFGIRATSPSVHDFDACWGSAELDTEVQKTADHLTKSNAKPINILEILPFSGNTTVRLASSFPTSTLICNDVCDDINSFIQGRLRRQAPKAIANYHFFQSQLNAVSLPDSYLNSIDLVVMHKKVNMGIDLPSVLRTLEPYIHSNTILSFSFWNSLSLQGAIWPLLVKYGLKTNLCTNEGPFFPVSRRYVVDHLFENGWSIQSELSLGLASPLRNRYLLPICLNVTSLPLNFGRTCLMLCTRS